MLATSDVIPYDAFGGSVSLSGDAAVVGAYGSDAYRGAAYLFRNLATAAGIVTESAKLTPSVGTEGYHFGSELSLSGGMGIIVDDRPNFAKGVGYLFRDLDTASGIVTESASLTPSGGGEAESYVWTVSLSGKTGVMGGYTSNAGKGAAYLFRNLDTVSGTIAEDARLTASDGVVHDAFGAHLSLSGDTSVVGAYSKDSSKGAAYLFRNLATASGTVTEHAKLTASDGLPGDFFGISTSLSGKVCLIGAHLGNAGKGAVYLFRNLATASGAVREDAKLITTDGAVNDYFGVATGLSGNTAMVGAVFHKDHQGAAYLFRNLDTASGTVTEDLKLTDSAGQEGVDHGERLGVSVALDGDVFALGSTQRAAGDVPNSGKILTGRVSAFTTLDEGGASRFTDGLSFASQDDWVIGQSTDGNQNTLSAGDTGSVSASGKAVYVGRTAGADNNGLTVAGTLTANSLQVGAAGNSGNALRISHSGTVTASGGVTVVSGSSVGGDGTLTGNLTLAPGAFFAFLPTATLTVTGSVTLPAGIGVTGLLGLDGGTPAGTYGLIDGTATNFATMGLAHWGQENAHSLGNGKTAWFQQQGAGLQLVVAGSGTGTVELPTLNLSRNGGQLTLTWTTTLNGLIPETSPTLTRGWQAVPTVPVQSGNTWTLTVPIAETRRFYRLRQP